MSTMIHTQSLIAVHRQDNYNVIETYLEIYPVVSPVSAYATN